VVETVAFRLASLRTEVAMQKATIEDLRKNEIWGFYLDEKPTFKQGPPTHELQELVTAEECQRYVDRIEELIRNGSQ